MVSIVSNVPLTPLCYTHNRSLTVDIQKQLRSKFDDNSSCNLSSFHFFEYASGIISWQISSFIKTLTHWYPPVFWLDILLLPSRVQQFGWLLWYLACYWIENRDMRNSKRRVGKTQNLPNCRPNNGHKLEIERGPHVLYEITVHVFHLCDQQSNGYV